MQHAIQAKDSESDKAGIDKGMSERASPCQPTITTSVLDTSPQFGCSRSSKEHAQCETLFAHREKARENVAMFGTYRGKEREIGTRDECRHAPLLNLQHAIQAKDSESDKAGIDKGMSERASPCQPTITTSVLDTSPQFGCSRSSKEHAQCETLFAHREKARENVAMFGTYRGKEREIGTRDECRHAPSTRPISPPVHQTKPLVRGSKHTNADIEGGREGPSRRASKASSGRLDDVAEIEVTQRWALPHHSSKTLCPG